MDWTRARRWARGSLALAIPLGFASWLTPSWCAAQTLDPAQPRMYRVEGVSGVKQRSAIAATGAAIIEVGADYVMLEATPEELGALRQLGLRPAQPAGDEVRPATFPADDPGYHDYAELTAELQATAAV